MEFLEYDYRIWQQKLITESILKEREKYPIKQYRTFDAEVQDAFWAGSWQAVCPAYGDIFWQLLWERMWSPEDAECFLAQMIQCIATGMEEQPYLTHIQKMTEEKGDVMTKAMRKKFLNFRKEFSSANLKGYTWGEYEKYRKNGYHQMSLFEEELPFS